MYIRNNMGNRFHPVLLTLLLGVLFAGCVTPPLDPVALPTQEAYAYYAGHRDTVDSNALVAMLSYSSSLVSAAAPDSWREFSGILSEYYARVVASNKVSNNYPVKPSAHTLRAYTLFIQVWSKDAAQSVAAADLVAAYTASVNSLIFRIISNEYKN